MNRGASWDTIRSSSEVRPKSKIYTPERDDGHPHPFHMRSSPPGVKPLLSGHLRDLSKCPLNIEVVKIAQCFLTINIQRLLCTVIKLHVVKEPIRSSSSLPFITDFNLFVNAKTLTDFSTYFSVPSA